MFSMNKVYKCWSTVYPCWQEAHFQLGLQSIKRWLLEIVASKRLEHGTLKMCTSTRHPPPFVETEHWYNSKVYRFKSHTLNATILIKNEQYCVAWWQKGGAKRLAILALGQQADESGEEERNQQSYRRRISFQLCFQLLKVPLLCYGCPDLKFFKR